MSEASNNLLERRQILGPAYRLFYDDPVAPVRGEGVWMEDVDGRRYLDAYNNVPVVGHCNSVVVAALAEQAATLNTHTRYLHNAVVRYAERLVDRFPAALDTAMFTCTGSEANDLALRVAAEFTERRGLIVTANAYHGVTSAVAEMSPSLGASLAPHVRTIPSPLAYEGTTEEIAQQFGRAVGTAADELEAAGTPVSALIMDTVFSSDGLYVDAGGLLTEAMAQVHARGGLFIADEVQGGFARTGRWWAFQREDCVPDMVSLGKPMGNGHPLAGLVLQSHLIESFGRHCRYFNTFGGNTVSAAVGLAVLDELERMDAPSHVTLVGRKMAAALNALTDRHPCIAAVRGSGLFWGVDIVDPADSTPDKATKLASDIVNGLREAGVLISASGPAASTLKIRPPLVFEAEHVDIFATALDEQCQAVTAINR